MTAKEVYDAVVIYAPGPVTTTCNLHARCESIKQCANPQMVPVVNFDPVKAKWVKVHKIPSMSSTDALACHNNALCFIEIKGTVDFVKFQINTNKTNAENLAKIKQKMKDYTSSLQKKFIDSIKICQGITRNKYFNDGIKLKYVLVTDVNLSPLAIFANQLSSLATGSSNWNVIYAAALGTAFSQATANLTNVSMSYKSCQEVDSYITGL